VADDGIGIPRDMLPRIFQPFVRVDQPTAQARSGLGLGLAVVRGLVELHDGQITAHSDGDGRGATFTLHLPMIPAPAAKPRGTAGNGDGNGNGAVRTSRSVLVIEDGEDARRAMLALLKLWGHQTHAAEDGPTGVRRAVEARPEVALVDIGLPGLDGYEVARQIRSLMGDSIHLVALTGYGLAEDRRKALEAGFDRHLAKPVDPRVLADVLNAPRDGGSLSAVRKADPG
jgi:CheY-like chemotaxis protein